MSPKTVKLLICSGNLGNAEPDVKSLGSWVPEDGLCHQVTENQKYPVVVRQEDFRKGGKNDENEKSSSGDKYKEDEEAAKKLEKFDLIVLGMQESTFEPVDEEAIEEIKAKLEEERDDNGEANDESDANDDNDGAKDSSDSSDESKGDSDDSKDSKDEKAGKKVADSLHSVSRQVSKQAAKTSRQVSKQAAKTSRQVSKQAAKTSRQAVKHATKGSKLAVKAATKVTDKLEKAAMKGAYAVNTLTASRDNTKASAEILTDGTAVLHELLQERLPSYTRLLSYQRGEMRLLVYSLNKNHSVQIKSTRAQNTGMAGLANKGGIVAEVVLDRGTVFSFMTCHLEAHEGLDKYARRCSTLGDILKGTKKYAVPSIYPDASLATHFCFVLGDLNFRTRYKGRIKYDEQIDDVNKLVLGKKWQELNQYDELRMAIEKQECLHGFSTLCCNFPPTFKVERGDGYVYKKNRTPSYTDRILWRTGDLLHDKLTPLAYESIDQFTTSDHKPIRGAFEVRLNQGVSLRKRQQV